MDAAALKSVPLFAGLSGHDLNQVARWADEVELPEGRELAKEGEFAYEFFVLLEGTVEVSKKGTKVRDMGPGEFFGEIGLVDEEARRTATVTTTSPVRAVVMTRRDFLEMEREFPEVAAQVQEAIKQRPHGHEHG
jgi:CRP-like cAMP-binding protein